MHSSIVSIIDKTLIICFKELSILFTIILKKFPVSRKTPLIDLTFLSVPDLAKIFPINYGGNTTLDNVPLTPKIENEEL